MVGNLVARLRREDVVGQDLEYGQLELR